MPKMFWYYSVILIGISLFLYTVIRKKAFRNLFAYFLSITSLGYLCEVLVLFVFESYQYKPGVFKDPMAENILGHLLCNGFFWGGTAVFVSAFYLNSIKIFFISIFYMLVEILFLKVDAYVHHWWRLYMTGAAAFVIFTLAKKWWMALEKNNHPIFRKFAFYMIAWVLLQGSTVVQNLLDLQHFYMGIVKNIYRDSILVSVPYQLVMAGVYVHFVTLHKGWYRTLLPLILTLLADCFFVYMDVLNFYNGWNLFYFEGVRVIGFIAYLLLEKYTLLFPSTTVKSAKA